MGGPVSTMFLRLFPELVSGIIYLDSFWHMPESYLSIKERQELAEHRHDDASFENKIEELFVANTPSSVRAMVLETMMATPKDVRLSACAPESQPHSIPWEKTFSIPALQLAAPGAKIDQHWHHHMPKLHVQELAGLGHFFFMEDPERVNEEAERFILEH